VAYAKPKPFGGYGGGYGYGAIAPYGIHGGIHAAPAVAVHQHTEQKVIAPYSVPTPYAVEKTVIQNEPYAVPHAVPTPVAVPVTKVVSKVLTNPLGALHQTETLHSHQAGAHRPLLGPSHSHAI